MIDESADLFINHVRPHSLQTKLIQFKLEQNYLRELWANGFILFQRFHALCPSLRHKVYHGSLTVVYNSDKKNEDIPYETFYRTCFIIV